MYPIIIIGGGIAGLTSSILLKRAGIDVVVVEKSSYPHHKVCGEYISNEVKPFLQRHQLFPEEVELPEIRNFVLSSISGKSASIPLDLGGFGLSRFYLDHFLYQKARAAGVDIFDKKQVKDVKWLEKHFSVMLNDGVELTSHLVIGAHGKRSTVDKSLDRDFLKKRSGYIGVKYHIQTHFPAETIALHNFDGGYCGISQVENDTYNLCYLGRREHLKKFGSISEMERNILYQNPHLKNIFENSTFLFSEPLVINEFSFEKKKTVENGVLMVGDAAGLITPLCGNGMALAFHSAKVLTEIIIANHTEGQFDTKKITDSYQKKWGRLFSFRMWTGRTVQNLFGAKISSEVAVGLVKNSKFMARQIIRNTHGKPF